MGVSEKRVTVPVWGGVPIIRTILFWGVYYGYSVGENTLTMLINTKNNKGPCFGSKP